MLIPMSLARPKRAWLYAAVCTATSVVGGLLGYAIGALLYRLDRTLADPGLWPRRQGRGFPRILRRWGAVIILLKGLTPIPYKLVTITSGFAGYNIVLFILCSIVARGGRFFIAAIAAQPLWRLDPSAGSRSISALWVGAWRRRAGAGLRHRHQDDLSPALRLLSRRFRLPLRLPS